MTPPALVIGKFLPPHLGHSHIIERALDLGGAVDVLVCDLPGQRPHARERAHWLSTIHPEARVRLVPDICGWHAGRACEARCSPNWAEHLSTLGLGPWRAVVGSEPYIEPFAAALGVEAVLVDPARRDHPVSGTAIRDDVSGSWQYLHPVVRAGLTRRIVVVGAESTGTTTLSRDLADAVRGPWVPEYGRQYSEELAAEHGSMWNVTWSSSDFDVIANRQMTLETDAIATWAESDDRAPAPGAVGPIAACDTDVLATAIWHRRYCGRDNHELMERAHAHPPLLYVLTSPAGVAFEQDGVRDGEHVRDEMTGWFRDTLARQAVPWIEVEGSPAERLDEVLRLAHRVVADEPLFRSPASS